MPTLYTITSQLMLKILLLLGLLLGLQACDSEEHQPTPAVRYELGELHTDQTGSPLFVELDHGRPIAAKSYPLSLNSQGVYRVLVGYAPRNNGDTTIYHLSLVPTLLPSSHQEGQKPHAVKLISHWRSKRHINLRLGIGRSYKGQHSLALQDLGVIRDTTGVRTQQLRLYHDNQLDRSDYTQEILLSCPTLSWNEKLRSGIDSVRIFIATNRGWTTINYLY